MTDSIRERFWRCMRYEPTDRVPYWSDWLGPHATWQSQGLPIPKDIDDADVKSWFIDHFGFEGMYSAFWGVPRVPVNIGICPDFREETLEQTPEYRVYRGGNGVVVKQFLSDAGSLHSTQFVKHPISNRDDWLAFRDEHLDPHAPGRYPDEAEWQALVADWKNRDAVVSIDGGSFYGFARDWIGVENVSVMFYDNPSLLHEIMEYLAVFFTEVLHRALHDVRIDFAMFWEDMCYKTASLISPAMFREFILPGYQHVTSFLREHGVELSWVDCDGNIEELIPLWIEGGVRGFYPLERAADMDAVTLREKYGHDIVMWGGVDKRALTEGRAAIDAELERLVPVIAEGGFIPLVDHGVPDDVPYEHYLYYVQRRRELTGWA